MNFDAFDTVVFTTVFLVPGFIWSTVLSMAFPRRTRAIEMRTIEFLTLSCVNHGLWIWLLIPVFRGTFLNNHPLPAGLCLLLPVLVSPVALRLLTGRLYQRDRVRHLLARFGFHTIHPIPTARDFHFSRGRPYWVIVRLRDGSLIYGLYGYRSFAGDDAAERDL